MFHIVVLYNVTKCILVMRVYNTIQLKYTKNNAKFINFVKEKCAKKKYLNML